MPDPTQPRGKGSVEPKMTGWRDVIEPLGFLERVALASEVDGRHDHAEEAAEMAALHEPSFGTESLARRMREVRQRPKRSKTHRMAGLTEKQGDVLATFVMVGGWLSLRELQADLARTAWTGSWKDFSTQGISNVLRVLAARGLVVCREVPAVKLRDPHKRWTITEAGSEANTAWLDAEEELWERERLAAAESDAPSEVGT